MYTNKGWLLAGEVAPHESNGGLRPDFAFVGVHHDRAVVFGRERGAGRTRDKALGLASVGDEISYGDHLKPQLFGDGKELRGARHCTVVVHDLGQYSHGLETGQPA